MLFTDVVLVWGWIVLFQCVLTIVVFLGYGNRVQIIHHWRWWFHQRLIGLFFGWQADINSSINRPYNECWSLHIFPSTGRCFMSEVWVLLNCFSNSGSVWPVFSATVQRSSILWEASRLDRKEISGEKNSWLKLASPFLQFTDTYAFLELIILATKLKQHTVIWILNYNRFKSVKLT